MATEQATILRLTRLFDAPRERVFDAWTNPDVLKQWWAAFPTWDTPEAEVDLREGGRYRLAMRNPDTGETHTVVGEYREIQRPERLAYTWAWDEKPEMTDGDTLVEIEFREDGEATEVVLTHTGFPSEQVRDQHAHGWNGCFANLESRVLG